MLSPIQNPKWLQFRIHAILSAVALVGIALGFYKLHTRDPPSIRRLKNLGHTVEYNVKGRGIFGVRDQDVWTVTYVLNSTEHLEESPPIELPNCIGITAGLNGPLPGKIECFPRSAKFPRLNMFSFRGPIGTKDVDLTFLNASRDLESLKLSCPTTSFEEISSLKQLKTLRFSFHKSISLDSLCNFQRLKHLGIHVENSADKPIDLTPLLEMESLKSLEISRDAINAEQLELLRERGIRVR